MHNGIENYKTYFVIVKTNNIKEAGKWVSLCSSTVMDGVKFEFYHDVTNSFII